MQKKILVMGCTGSIGSQTLDIARKMPESFKVVGLCAGKNKEALNKAMKEFSCKGTLFEEDGMEGISRLIEESNADIAVNGIAGSQGLEPSILVLKKGIDLALANKESVVMAWDLIKDIGKKTGASIIPVDSEHSAIFNLTEKIGKENISQLIITASGGPFRNLPREELFKVTLEQALRHPTWNMGKKITIDSASLGNKGLEVIEAVRLFGFDPKDVKVLVHPQSIVHSLVRTKDGMIYAQLSNPDMRHPIFGALVWPEYKENYMETFDLAEHELTFQKPRLNDFPLLSLAYKCAEKGNSYPIAYNAANEIAVQSFIDHKAGFMDIPYCVEKVLEADWSQKVESINTVYEMDSKARIMAKKIIDSLSGEVQ